MSWRTNRRIFFWLPLLQRTQKIRLPEALLFMTLHTMNICLVTYNSQKLKKSPLPRLSQTNFYWPVVMDPLTQYLSASFGLVCGTQQAPLLRTQGPCPGHSSQLSAPRSELAGINATIKLFLYLCQRYDVRDGAITL
jgi:hypothetical protein